MTQILQAGELVADRFEVVGFLAEGGMGQVYEARDRTLGGQVALKLLNAFNVADPAVNRRFRREIQLARQVTHPNVCRIHDVYTHRITRGLHTELDVIVVTMELLRGETLESLLARRGRLAEEEALPIVRQMAAALDAAHAAGVIHRDLKPGNVMLVPREGGTGPGDGEPGPRVVVTDFGLARSVSAEPASTTTPVTGEMKVVGTADYMSPEQLRGVAVGPASDLYALGVVIFEMVTGRRPYSAANPMTLLTKRATEPPSSPLEHRPDLDPRWAGVILRCLEQEAERRPSSAGEVARLLAGRGAGAPPRATLSPPRPGVLVLGVAATSLVVGLLVSLALRQTPREADSYSQAVQLTTAPGLELDPAFSPDASAIAYSSDASGSFEIYVRELGPGGGERRLTRGGRSFEPVFSPDGALVAYHSASDGGIWAVAATGGEPRRLTREGSKPAFSPDGRLLAFQSDSAPVISDNSVPAFDPSVLWLLDLASGRLRQLTRSGQPPGGHGAPAFSPEGRRIAFTATRRGSSEIWSVDVEGGDPVRLVGDPDPALDPVFDPGGRRLYFSGLTRQVYSLWALPLDRGGRPQGPPREITNLGLASLRLAALTPDATKMAFTALFTRSNLQLLPLGPGGVPAGEPRHLTTGTGRNTRPSFSPDGSRLAWERWTRGGNADVWVMDADGGGATQVTVDPANEYQPSWFPGGRRIAFLRRIGGIHRLFAIDADGGTAQELAALADDVDWARLSPDGTRVAYHSRAADDGTLHVYLYDLRSGRSRQLSHGPDLTGFPCWSNDGRWIVLQRRQRDYHQMILMPSDGGEAVPLTDREAQHYPYSFSPDGRKIAFASDRGGRWNLWWMDSETREERRLTDLELAGGYVRYPAWSPRGDRIVYELAESSGDVWVSERAPRE